MKSLLEGIEGAIETMYTKHGTTDLHYGDVFRIGRGDYSWPLGGGSLLPQNREACATPIRWDRNCPVTLRAMTFGTPDSLGQRQPWLGSRMLRLVIFTDPIQSFTLHNYGQSEHEDSPHYSDQARLSSQRRLKPTYFNKADLLKHIVSTKTLDVRVD